jgi:REP element-mobilizing transposase RayT
MSEKYKTTEGGLYFITFSIVSWIDLFVRREYQEILIESTKFCQEKKGLQLFCYCIMPSHVHWIASRKQGNLSNVLRDYKSFTARKLIKEVSTNPSESRKEWILKQFKDYGIKSSQNQYYQVWKHDNHSFWLETSWMIDQKLDYIHNNPVEAGFVNEPNEWRMSSASLSSPLKVIDL